MAIISINIIADADRARRALRGFGGDLDRFGNDAQRNGGRIASVLGSIGQAAIVAGAAGVTAAGALAVDGLKKFMDFERGMNEVFTLIPGASAAAMDEMTQQVKTFSTDFGVLPSEVIPSLYEALSSGVPEDNVFAFLEVAQKAARGGVTELATTVDGLTTVINSYGADTIDAARASDVMFQTVKFGKVTFDDLAGQMYDVAPVAAAMGVSFEEVGAGLALLTSKGVPARVATTQMRSAITELSKEAGPTSAFAKFKDIAGTTFPEFTKQGGTLSEALKLMADRAKSTNTPLLDMFSSVEAGQGFVSIASDDMAGFNNMLGEMQNAAGSTDAAFEQMNKGIGPIWGKLKAQAEVFRIEIGERLAPILVWLYDWFSVHGPKAMAYLRSKWDEIRPTVEAFARLVRDKALKAMRDLHRFVTTKVVPMLRDARREFDENRDTINKIAGAVLAVVAAWKLASIGISAVEGAIVLVTVAQAVFNAMTLANPWVLAAVGIVLAISAVAGTIFWLVTQTEEGRRIWDATWFEMEKVVRQVWDEALKPIAAWFEEKWVKDIWPKVTGSIKDFQEAWPQIKEAILDAYDVAIKPIVTFLADNMEMLKNLGIALGVIVAVFVALGVAVAVAGVVVVGIALALGALVGLIVGVVFVVIMRFVNIWWDLFNNGRDAVGALIDVVENFIQDLWTSVQSAIAFVWNLAQVWWDVVNNIKTAVGGAKDWIVARFDEVVAFVAGLPGRIADAAAGMWGGIKNGLLGVLRSVAEMWNSSIGSLTFSIPDWIPGFGGKSYDFPRMAVPHLASGGIVYGPTLALIGEAGPEAVVPLSRLGDTHIHLTVISTGLGADSPQIQRDVVAAIRGYERHNGRVLTGAAG